MAYTVALALGSLLMILASTGTVELGTVYTTGSKFRTTSNFRPSALSARRIAPLYARDRNIDLQQMHELKDQLKTLEVHQKKRVQRAEERVIREKALIASAEGPSTLNLIQLFTTPLALAVGARGYLESTKAKRELAQKKQEFRRQTALYTQKLAQQRRALDEIQPKKGGVMSTLSKASDIPVTRKAALGFAAAGIAATGVKVGLTVAGSQTEELARQRERTKQAELEQQAEVAKLAATQEKLSKLENRLNSAMMDENDLRDQLSKNKLFSAKEIERLQEKLDAEQNELQNVQNQAKGAVDAALLEAKESMERSAANAAPEGGISFGDPRVKIALAGTSGLAAALGVLTVNTKNEASREIEDLETKFKSDLSTVKGELEFEREESAKITGELKEESSQLRNRLNLQAKREEELQETIQKQEQRAGELTRLIGQLRESESSLSSSLESLTAAKNEAERKAVGLRFEIDELNDSLKQSKETLEQQTQASEMAAVEAAAKVSKLESEINDLKSAVTTLEEKDAFARALNEERLIVIEAKEKELSALRAAMDQASREASEALEAEKERVDNLNTERNELEAQLNKWQQAHEELQKAAQDSEKKYTEDVRNFEDRLATLQGSLDDTKKNLQTATEELESYRELAASREMEITQKNEDINSLQAKLNERTADLELTETKLKATSKELETERSAALNLSKELERLQISFEESSRMNEQLSVQYQKEVQTLNEAIDHAKAALEKVTTEAAAQYEASRLERESLEATVAALEAQRKDLERRASTLTSENEVLSRELTETRQVAQADVERLTAAYDDLTHDLEVASASEERLRVVNAKLKDVENELKDAKSAVKAADEGSTAMAKELEVRIAAVQAGFEAEKERIRTELKKEYGEQITRMKNELQKDQPDEQLVEASQRSRAYEDALSEARGELEQLEATYEVQVGELSGQVDTLQEKVLKPKPVVRKTGDQVTEMSSEEATEKKDEKVEVAAGSVQTTASGLKLKRPPPRRPTS